MSPPQQDRIRVKNLLAIRGAHGPADNLEFPSSSVVAGRQDQKKGAGGDPASSRSGIRAAEKQVPKEGGRIVSLIKARWSLNRAVICGLWISSSLRPRAIEVTTASYDAPGGTIYPPQKTRLRQALLSGPNSFGDPSSDHRRPSSLFASPAQFRLTNPLQPSPHFFKPSSHSPDATCVFIRAVSTDENTGLHSRHPVCETTHSAPATHTHAPLSLSSGPFFCLGWCQAGSQIPA